MNHTIELRDSNVVIIANDFNLTIMNSIWLYKHKIFTEEELQGCSNSPIHFETRTDDFIVSIVPNRLQFSINPTYDNDAKKLILSKIGKLIETLPHTPFSAAGLNFIYNVTPADKDINRLSRSLFCNESSKLFDGLEAKNVRFGGYFSQNFIDARFRLDAKPVKLTTPQTTEETIQLSYNFNVNITADDDTSKITDLFNKWDEAKKHTKELTEKINLKDQNV
ncbi:MAG: hypothetical protein KKD21_12940 [Proteobacteria bacterium]|nr:hypothetical protein [Pseudomonadota bacterium]MBU1697925.1 hypothetical protein [Pseudomonadota bacterium]